MGVKGLNTWITANFANVMQQLDGRSQTQSYDHVLVDLNGVVHAACRRLPVWACRAYEPDERGGGGAERGGGGGAERGGGGGALAALALYRRAALCLMPPDETPARAALVDAVRPAAARSPG